MRSLTVLKDVMDTSESDVPTRVVPKDISSKEEKKILRRNQNSLPHSPPMHEELTDEIGALYSPNQMIDSIYSPNHFVREDPVMEIPKEDVDEGVLMDPADVSSLPDTDAQTSRSVFVRMYARFAACVSVLSISPRQAVSLMMAENELWDFNDGDTDDCSDERDQIHRLTSWNTLETSGTSHTNGSEKENGPAALRKRARRHSLDRKRVVHFDYPVISSLKECPRPDPRDLPKLYFTEEELGQIEDDRESTYTADDVEVVCVSSSLSSDGEERKHYSSNLPTSRRSGKYAKTQGLEGNHHPPRSTRSMDATTTTSSTSSHNNHMGTGAPEVRKRHIKSVQIYLRERSREKSPR